MASPTPLQRIMFEQLRTKEIFERSRLHAFAYIDGVHERGVPPSALDLEALCSFDEALPEETTDPLELLDLLHRHGSPCTIAQTGARYFGFVNGNALPPAVATRWLTDVWDQNCALQVMSPIVSRLELVCERWMVDLLGFDAQTTVVSYVGGTSIATLCGVAAARYALLQRKGWDVNENGMCGAPTLRIVMGEGAHGSVLKALALLGFGKRCIEWVPVDEQGRMDASRLPSLDDTTIVIAQAGHVSTGAFDPFEQICKATAAARSWLHVDGAFGLWAAACPALKHLVAGVEGADSWSLDGHKTLNTPYDCAMIVCKHKDMLAGAMRATGAYLQLGNARDGMMLSPDMSRRARAVELWASLRFLGRCGVAELVEELWKRAVQFAQLLREADFIVLNDVVFNQVLVKCNSTEVTKATLARIQEMGECWCGGTTWQGEHAIRISICSWSTTAEDVRRSVAAFKIAREQATAGDDGA